jgi:putative phosphoesterase
MRIGVISDTHGMFNPAVKSHFATVEHILHAGDIGKQAVIEQLQMIAPVSAITGNVDWDKPLDQLYPRTLSLELAGCIIYMTHIGDKPANLVNHLPNPRPDIYIFGHSHIPLVERLDEVLFLNPGSAGSPRFGRKPSLAILTIKHGEPTVELIWL